MSLIELEGIGEASREERLKAFRLLKNELIGSSEMKAVYFDQGIIEVFMPMLGKEEDEQLLNEVLAILNSYFFDFPRAMEVFSCFKPKLVQIHFFLQMYRDSPGLVDMVLRMLKNLLAQNIVRPHDFQGQQLVQSLAPLMTSKFRIELVAKILSMLCVYQEFKAVVAKNKPLLDKLLDQIINNHLLISDQCIENCLAALAAACHLNEETALYVYKYPHALRGVLYFFRHPEKRININVALILTSVNQFHKLPGEFQQKFRWIIMQMIQILPSSIDTLQDQRLAQEICEIISSIAVSCKEPRAMQKVAGDVEAIEKIGELLLSRTLAKEQNQYQEEVAELEKLHQSNEEDDEEEDEDMMHCGGGEQEEGQIITASQSAKASRPAQTTGYQYKLLHHSLFEVLASLTSNEESCRKKLIEKKKVLDELMLGIKSPNKTVKVAALQLFVSLSRSDKMLKAIILEHAQFQKEIARIIMDQDHFDYDTVLVACKSLCNFAFDNQKQVIKEENLVASLVKFTEFVGPNNSNELKIAAIFTLKNLLYNITKEVKTQIMKELTYERLVKLLDDENQKVQEQALMAFRNLLTKTEEEIQLVLSEGNQAFLKKLEEKLNHPETAIVIQTVYVLSSIAAGSQKHKKVVMEERFFMKAIALLKSTESANLKIACLNLIMNLAWKENDSESKIRKQIMEMNLVDMLKDMQEQERDPETRVFLSRAIKKLT